MALADVDSDFAKFKQYLQVKQSIAYEIRNLSDFLKKHVGERKSEECRQLMVKLAEDRFTLAVVGQFKRGKSSLMNAIIGRDLLPTGVLPLTSAITVLKYGPRERLMILKEGALYPEEAPISSLVEYVTEKGNPGNVKKVERAVLELPVQFLRRGLEFVDTPGIGSAIEANTATTYGFLPRSDAVIFVTSVDTPLTRAETDFLQSIREYVRKVFFVVNKIDLAGGKERLEILNFISERLERQTGAEEVQIFPVSSAMALESKLAGKEEGYEKSGVKALQEALAKFLSSEKSHGLLVSVLDKVLRVATEAHHELSLLKLAGETSREEVQKKMAALKERFQVLRKARAKSQQEVRERILPWAREKISPEIAAFRADEADVLLGELNEALSQSNWELSILAAQDVARQMLPRFKQDLEKWTKEKAESLDPAFLQALQMEWVKIERELQDVPAAAVEVLGGLGEEAASETSIELPTHWVLQRPSFGNVDWNPKLPILAACLPLFVVRPIVRGRLVAEIEGLIGFYAERIEDAFLKGVDDALNRLDFEIEKRAGEIESRIVQAVEGKRVTKSIDGHWQILELDREELSRELDTLEAIEKKLARIRTAMLEGEPSLSGEPSGEPIFPAFEPSPLSVPEQELLSGAALNKATGSEVEKDLLPDLATRGCPVCNRMIDAAYRFYAGRQYELATQEQAQRAHAASLGFCPLHTWQLEAMSSPHGLSQGFPRLMERLSADLSRLALSENSNPGESVLTLVPSAKDCEVCRLVQDAEKIYLNSFAAFIQTPEGHKAYMNSQGVCLHHLGLLISIVPSKEEVQFLLEHAARLFAQISEDMQNYALKRDALRRNIQNLDEEDAYLRGLIHSVGAKKVCFPWEMDAEV